MFSPEPNFSDLLDALTEQYATKHMELEARWVAKHQEAQNRIDATGVHPITPLTGLYDFITKGLDESFERERQKLFDEFDRAAAALEAEWQQSHTNNHLIRTN